MPTQMPTQMLTRMTRRRWLYGSLMLVVSWLAACNRGKWVDNEAKSPVASSNAKPLMLTSPSLQAASMPPQFTCDPANQSPALSWNAPPAGTQSWLLLLESEASPAKLHWLVYDLPASLRQLPAGLPNQPFLTQGGLQAKNDFGEYGYRSPCRSAAQNSSYSFSLYALKSLLDLPPGVSPSEVRAALQAQILAEVSLSFQVSPA